MKVLNKTNSIQYLPDGDGNKIALKAGSIIEGRLIPGENEIPSGVMDKIKKCIGSDRWSNYAQFIIVEGDTIVSPTPVKKKKDMTAEELLGIIRKTHDDRVLIELINNENLRDEPRKTVTDAVEKRMVALGKEREAATANKKKAKNDGEHDKK